MAIETFIKDPDAVLDYAMDWTDWLDDSETISSHTVTVDDGLTKDSDSESSGIVTIWLSGGTANTTYNVVVHITTSDSRTDDRTFRVMVVNR
jgi:hypothetical protein